MSNVDIDVDVKMIVEMNVDVKMNVEMNVNVKMDVECQNGRFRLSRFEIYERFGEFDVQMYTQKPERREISNPTIAKAGHACQNRRLYRHLPKSASNVATRQKDLEDEWWN